MAQNETPITIVGNLVADLDLRTTNAGTPVASFRVCAQPRVYDKTSNQWGDGDPSFWSCSLWRGKAEAAAQQLSKGQPVILTGTVAQRNWEDDQGNKRSQMEITVQDIGPAILPQKQGGGYGSNQRNQAQPSGVNHQGGFGTQPDPDPWNAEPTDQPPF